MINRNLIVLWICQLISATGTITMVTLGGIIGAQLTSNPAWATLPASLWVLATAAATVPASFLMRRIGRPQGFACGALLSCAALVIAIWALRHSSFAGFLAASAIFGVNMAFALQYRFAAVESTAPQYAGRAVSLVLLGSVGGAFLGPYILRHTANSVDGVVYEGTMLALAALYFVCAVCALFLRRTDLSDTTANRSTARPIGEVFRQPVYIVAVLAGATAYGVMVFVMTATPLSMHVIDGFTLEETSTVIRAHALAMYLPSFVSGYLIDRLGVTKMLTAGAALLLGALCIGMTGHALNQYWLSLILLGVGWNFMFVGGTTMLTYTYLPSERFRAQSVNEFVVFGTTAAGSLLAGTIMYSFGWFTTVTAPISLLVVVFAALFFVRRDPLLVRPHSARQA